MALLRLIRGNLMECEREINGNITKSDSKFALIFVNHHI